MNVFDSRSIFELAYYQNTRVFDVGRTGGSDQAYLITSAIADSSLSSVELNAVCLAIRGEISKLPGVSGCSIRTVGFDMTDPWEHGGGPRMVFDESWTLNGFHVETRREIPESVRGTRIEQHLSKSYTTHLWFASTADSDVSGVLPVLFRQLERVTLIRGPVPRPSIAYGIL